MVFKIKPLSTEVYDTTIDTHYLQLWDAPVIWMWFEWNKD